MIERWHAEPAQRRRVRKIPVLPAGRHGAEHQEPVQGPGRPGGIGQPAARPEGFQRGAGIGMGGDVDRPVGGGVGNTRLLRRHETGELQRIPQDHLRPPVRHDRPQIRPHARRQAQDEPVQLHQRRRRAGQRGADARPFRQAGEVVLQAGVLEAAGEMDQARRLHHRADLASGGERHLVPGLMQGQGVRHHGVDMTVGGNAGAKESHGDDSPRSGGWSIVHWISAFGPEPGQGLS